MKRDFFHASLKPDGPVQGRLIRRGLNYFPYSSWGFGTEQTSGHNAFVWEDLGKHKDVDILALTYLPDDQNSRRFRVLSRVQDPWDGEGSEPSDDGATGMLFELIGHPSIYNQMASLDNGSWEGAFAQLTESNSGDRIWEDGQWTWLRVNVVDNTMKARVWADKTPEPNEWHLVGETPITDEGYVGLALRGNNTFCPYFSVDTSGVSAPMPEDSLGANQYRASSETYADFEAMEEEWEPYWASALVDEEDDPHFLEVTAEDFPDVWGKKYESSIFNNNENMFYEDEIFFGRDIYPTMVEPGHDHQEVLGVYNIRPNLNTQSYMFFLETPGETPDNDDFEEDFQYSEMWAGAGISSDNLLFVGLTPHVKQRTSWSWSSEINMWNAVHNFDSEDVYEIGYVGNASLKTLIAVRFRKDFDTYRVKAWIVGEDEPDWQITRTLTPEDVRPLPGVPRLETGGPCYWGYSVDGSTVPIDGVWPHDG